MKRLSVLLAVASLLAIPALAKNKKPTLPEDVLRARTVLVVIDPDAGEPLDQPSANATARENVEKALSEWGRFSVVMDGAQSDLVITVRTGGTGVVRPTIKGGPIDSRPGLGQTTDSTVRIGGQHGTPPPLSPPDAAPQDRGPHIGNEVGPKDDTFAVYRRSMQEQDPFDSAPVWRYAAKDCLRAPEVSAVEQFRKAIAEAEKPQPPKKP